MTQSPDKLTMTPILPDVAARQAEHDLRAPLINIQGFSGELEEALDRLSVLIGVHEAGLPTEFHNHVSQLLGQDLIPCLEYLGSAVAELHQRIDTLSRTYHIVPICRLQE